MGDDYVASLPVGSSIHRGKEDDPPGSVQEDHGEGHQARDDEEARGFPMEPECARAERVCEDVDQGEGPGHEAEAEAHCVSKQVFVGKDLSLFSLGELLQICVRSGKKYNFVTNKLVHLSSMRYMR